MSNEKDVSKELADAVSKVLSRRDAVKKAGSIAAGAALAFLGLSMPGVSQQKEARACGWCCDWSCMEGCYLSCMGCSGSCYQTCEGSCNGCTETCRDECNNDCTASCKTSCWGTCTGAESD